MTQEEINKRKEAIAKFMGWEEKFHPVNQIHTSWDWIMPAVEKIESDGEYIVAVSENQCRIYENPFFEESIPVIEFEASTKIEATFLAVSDFCLNHFTK